MASHSRIIFLGALLLMLICQPLSAAEAAGSRVLRISGSTTVLPIAQRGAEYFMGLKPDTQLSVSGTGSGEGLKALVEKATDIATSSRDLKPREIQRLTEHGVEMIRHTVAIDCLVVVVHPDNPVDNLSLDQLKGLYDGRIRNWREVGGVDKKIIAINRDVSSGTFETWLEMVLQGERFRPDAQMQTSSGGVAYAVSGNRYAIGYIGLGYVTPRVKVVSVNGVQPSLQTVRSGEYPLARKLFMFTLTDPTPLALDFINFLTSPDGRKLVEKEGFISVEATDMTEPEAGVLKAGSVEATDMTEPEAGVSRPGPVEATDMTEPEAGAPKPGLVEAADD